jgi:hypothetical protein
VSTRLRALGAVVAMVLLTGGCAAGTHPGAAAVVGGTDISVKDVDETTRAVSTAIGQSVGTADIVNQMVNDALVDQVRQERSISVSDAEIAQAAPLVFNNDEVYQRFQADPVARDFLNQIAAGAITAIKLGGGTGVNDPNAQQKQQQGLQDVKDASKDIKVKVAPRFGQWTDGKLDSTISGSLSRESDQAKAKREADQNTQQQGQG